MISRKGAYGIFWGCRAYPQCKGTRDSMGRSKADREEYKRTINKDNEDKEVLRGLAEEIDKHDLKEGQKFSFKKTS